MRTTREFTTTSRALRMVYQYLGQFSDQLLATARKSGLCSVDELPSYHKALLLLECLNKPPLMSELEKDSRG